MVKRGVRAVVVVVVQEGWQEGSALVAGVVRTRIGPLAGDGLDEAFGLAVGLRAVGAREQVPQPQSSRQLCANSLERYEAPRSVSTRSMETPWAA